VEKKIYQIARPSLLYPLKDKITFAKGTYIGISASRKHTDPV